MFAKLAQRVAAIVAFAVLAMALSGPEISIVQPSNGLIPAGSTLRAVVQSTDNVSITVSLLALNGGYSSSKSATPLPTESDLYYYFYAEFILPLSASGGFQLSAVMDIYPETITSLSLTVFQNRIPAFSLPPRLPKQSRRRCRYNGAPRTTMCSFDYGNIEQ